ncbi:MAG: biopolymer transporter ExbD [Acidobacteriota bacterium]
MAFSVSGGNGGGSGSGLARRRFGGSNGTLSEINIVPLVDVVLVLLIIFMLTAHVMEFGLEINVPEVKQVKDTNEELPVISISRNGRLYLNEKPININEIAAEIPKRFKNQKSVYIMADKATIYDPIAQVISTLDQAHLGVKLVTKPQENAGK